MNTPAPRPAAPTPEEMHQLALRVAVLGVREDDAKQAYAAARSAAAQPFARARALGTRQLEIILPGNVPAGVLAIKAGGDSYAVNEAKLLELVHAATPSDTEQYVLPAATDDGRAVAYLMQHCPDLVELRIKPGALSDERAVKVLAEHAPDLVARRIAGPERQRLQKYLEKHEGKVPDPMTGEPVQVATVTHHDPTGDFAWTGKNEFMPRVREALETGRLVITASGDVRETVTGSVVAPEAIEAVAE